MRDRDSQAIVRRAVRIALIGLCIAAGASSVGAQAPAGAGSSGGHMDMKKSPDHSGMKM